MKTVGLLLAVCSIGHSLLHQDFYDFETGNDGISTTKFSLANETIVFYDKFYDELKVNAKGYITLHVSTNEESKQDSAILAPFMSDLHSTETGAINYQERRDVETLERAMRHIQNAFDGGVLGNFQAKTAFVVTWRNMQSRQHPGVQVTFQCVIVTDGHASYVIFLYPSDLLVSGENALELRNRFLARVGFSNTGNRQLEELSAAELVEGGNAAPGVWVFQIGGVFGRLNDRSSSHGKKPRRNHHRRRQSGFTPPEVNVNDYGQSGCGSSFCDPYTATCETFPEGSCCVCVDGFIGNGDECVQKNGSIPFNGGVSGYLIVMNPDNSWSNESAATMDQHSFMSLEDGRAFTALAGGEGLSSRLILALQPMTIFTSTLGWLIAKTEIPAVNGFQYTGGRVVSDTYIRYTTGAYEFRIRQEFLGFEEEPEVEAIAKALKGTVSINGRLPAIDEGVSVAYDDYSQIYMRTGPGSLRSRDTRTYRVGDTTHSYTIDQSIRFESCEAAYEHVPQNLVVDVSQVFNEYFSSENSLRYAMNNRVRPADEVGVHPTEPTPPPRTQPPEPSQDTSMTLCERSYADAQKLINENPFSSENYFVPTCTDVGRFAPRQCNAYDQVCWCVDQDTGNEIPGTRTDPQIGYSLDCSDIESTDQRTPCQKARAAAQESRTETGSDVNSMYMPRCMESGAFEPVQQLPDGSFMCVDFNGAEVSRSAEQPHCLTPCQLEAYDSKTNNIFLNADNFVVVCLENGEYAAKQCVEKYCYCIDEAGWEIKDSRVETTGVNGDDIDLDCEEFRILDDETNEVPPSPTTTSSTTTSSTTIATSTPTTTPTTTPSIVPSPAEPDRLIFAQTMGINAIDLPVVPKENFKSKRIFASSDQRAVALAYDCSSRRYFWTDVSKRKIYSSIIDGNGTRTTVVSSGLRSPEGIAVDYTNGKIYWTDSDYDRIEVANYDGSSRSVVVSGDMVNPRGIAVDPIRGRMYWTDWNRNAPKIWVADLDGSNKKVLVSDHIVLPNDITIDFQRRKVCFVDAGTYKIECMSLDGQCRHTIYQMGQVPRPHPFGLAVAGDLVYYSSWGGSRVVHSVNYRTGEHVAIANPTGAHGQLYGVALVAAQCPKVSDGCSGQSCVTGCEP